MTNAPKTDMRPLSEQVRTIVHAWDVGDSRREDVRKLADAILEMEQALASREKAPKDNTGVPCEFCGERPKSLLIERRDDKLLICIARESDKKDALGLAKLIKQFAAGLE